MKAERLKNIDKWLMKKQAKYNMRSKSSEGDNDKASEHQDDENDDENNESYFSLHKHVHKTGTNPFLMNRSLF